MLECDLVMRGGVTSGIVYPKAAATLAQRYRFRSIGGTSAGAIAASITAAAEFGRLSERNKHAFESHIAILPEALAAREGSGQSLLRRLFAPADDAAPLFDLLINIQKARTPRDKPTRDKVLSVLFALNRQFMILPILLSLIALCVATLCATGATLEGAVVVGTLSGIGWTLLLVAVGAGLWLHRQLNGVAKNNFGFCSGMPPKSQAPDNGELPLTLWMHNQIQRAAGLSDREAPLTFGDLWQAEKCKTTRAHDLDMRAEDFLRAPRNIELVLMTTNLTHGMSGRLPFLDGGDRLYFNEEEIRGLLPGSVVDWMLKRAASDPKAPYGYHRLPEPQHLPVLLGARMSLSFPFLLSAVRLHELQRDDQLSPVWYSDGGITSNFPIHFFDAPLPTRPTFCINLVSWEQKLSVENDREGATAAEGEVAFAARRSSSTDPKKLVWMTRGNNQSAALTNRFDEREGVGSLAGMFFAILDTARLWGDNELMRMPGFRERIVHVALTATEGGLNLDMDQVTIGNVADRGKVAGALIGEVFDPSISKRSDGQDITHGFANHRWVRFRTFMAAQEAAGEKFASAMNKWDQLSPTLKEMIEGQPDGPRKIGYELAERQREFVSEETRNYCRLVTAWLRKRHSDSFNSFDRQGRGRSPRPKPTLAMRPPGSSDPGVDLSPSSTGSGVQRL